MSVSQRLVRSTFKAFDDDSWMRAGSSVGHTSRKRSDNLNIMRSPKYLFFSGSAKLSLKKRLSIGVVAIALTTTFFTTTIALYMVRQSIREEVANDEFQRLSAIGDAVDQKFISRRTLLATFVKSVELQGISSPKDIQNYLLEHYGTLKNAFSNVSVFDLQGNLTANFHPEWDGTVNVADREFFRDVLSSAKGAISQPIKNRKSQTPQVLMTEPLLDNQGRPIAVIGASIDLDGNNFLGPLAEAKFGKSGYMFILNTSGLIVSHPVKSRILQHTSTPAGNSDAASIALSGFEGTTEATSRTGRDGLYAFKRIKQTNWILGAVYPEHEVFENFQTIERGAVVGAFLLSLMAGALALYALRHFLSPLQSLERRMQAMDGVTSYVPSEENFSQDEIGKLSRTFDKLMSERQLYQDRMQASETHLRQILAHAGDAFIAIDRSGFITTWNRQAEMTFGWSSNEAIGQKMPKFIGLRNFAELPERIDGTTINTCLGPIINGRISASAKHRDGHDIPIELSVASIDMGDHFVANAFLHDVTVRKISELALAKSERRLKTICDNMPALISEIDIDLRFTYANAPHQNWLNVEVASLIGKSMVESLGVQDCTAMSSYLKRAIRGEDVRFKTTLSVQSSEINVQMNFIPNKDANGQVVGVYCMILDRTEEHKSKQLLRSSARQLKAITDNIPVLISYIDRDERVQFMNATFCSWLGVGNNDPIGRSAVEVLGNQLYEQRRDKIRRALAGERVEFELQTVTPAGERHLHSVYIPDSQPGGSIQGIFTLSTDVSGLKAAENRLERLARLDPLTELPNRRQFDERLAQALERCRRTERPMALLFLDVDNFKLINDNLGHGTGDSVLKVFASRLNTSLRTTDTAARLAGDEFVVILEDLNVVSEADMVASKLSSVLREPIDVEGSTITVTCSIGVAWCLGEPMTSKEIMAKADKALYAAKAAGRDTHRLA